MTLSVLPALQGERGLKGTEGDKGDKGEQGMPGEKVRDLCRAGEGWVGDHGELQSGRWTEHGGIPVPSVLVLVCTLAWCWAPGQGELP